MSQKYQVKIIFEKSTNAKNAIGENGENGMTLFLTGQTVQGAVHLNCLTSIALNGICLDVHGRAKISFDNFHTHYKAHVVYLHEHIQIWCHKENGHNKFLPPGQYQFPFQFTIDGKCPANFKGVHGSINYHCKLTVEEKAQSRWLPHWIWSRRRIQLVPFGIREQPSPLEFTTAVNQEISHTLNIKDELNVELKATITLLSDKFHANEKIPLKLAIEDCPQLAGIEFHALAYRIVEYVNYEVEKQHCREKNCLQRESIPLTAFNLTVDKNQINLQTNEIHSNGPSIHNCSIIHKFHVLKLHLCFSYDGTKMMTKECWFQIKIY